MFMRNFEINVNSLSSFVKLTIIQNLHQIEITEANLKDIALESNTLDHIFSCEENCSIDEAICKF